LQLVPITARQFEVAEPIHCIL